MTCWATPQDGGGGVRGGGARRRLTVDSEGAGGRLDPAQLVGGLAPVGA